MSAKDKDAFEAITAGVFTDGELQRAIQEATTVPYSREPVQPSRQALLELLDVVLATRVELCLEGDWQALTREFLSRTTHHLDVRLGEEILVENPGSLLTPASLMVLERGNNIVGYFGGLEVMSWYNVPLDGDEALSSEIDDYRVDQGLHLMLNTARVIYPDGEIEAVGSTTVPLSHGQPEMYRVLRQE